MSKSIGNKSTWVLIMLVLIGAVLGSFIGNLAANSSLSWLNYGKTFGLTSPIVLDMAVLTLTLLPMIIMFIIFQDKLVKGMTAGAVKG